MKKMITMILATAVTFAFVGCSSDGLKEQQLPFHFDDADYLLIDNGAPENAVRITDKDVLQTYSQEFNSHKYVKTGQSSDDRYDYRLVWYDANDQSLATIYIIQENGYKIRYDGADYKVAADLNINQELYQNLFESM